METNHDAVSVSYIRMAIVSTLGIVLLLAVGGAIIAGAYLLSAHAVDVNNATQHALMIREQTSQLRAAIPTCRALGQLAHDSNAILNLPSVKSAPPSARPLVAFFADFQRVFKASNCNAVLAFAKKVHS